MKLIVYKYNDVVEELKMNEQETYVFGRKDSCDVVLDKHPGISREHFEIAQDNTGRWRVNVLSDIKLIEIQGEERKDFIIEGKGEFLLNPYVFRFEGAVTSETPINTHLESHADAPIGEEESQDLFQDEPSQNDDEDFTGDDGKTNIQGFSGLPYIKIIGEEGKKSEYFRLEGNLWVVGGHESASVFIREPSAVQSHFEISKTDKGFFIVDLGSQQGTDLNGQRLVAKKPTRLLSGDILSVGQTSMQFELRDKAFKRKVSNIPLNMYKNPLVFFDQEVAMVSLDDEEAGEGSAEEIQEKPGVNPEQKRKRILMAVASLFAFAAIVSQVMPQQSQEETKIDNADPFGQLPQSEKKLVLQTYNLANQYYLERNYANALVQINKLHEIIPVYKNSREMEEYCINDQQVQAEKAEIARRRREQEELELRVNSAIAQCEGQYSRSDDIEGVKACLVPASDLDPSNPRISQLITEVEARLEEKKIREKMRQEVEDKARRGRELYARARTLHKKQKWLDAIEAYENHIHSGLPDPKRLVKKSKRNLANIEYQINSKKSKLIGAAQAKYGGTELREAIRLARRAQRVDPYDPKISAFLFQVEKELTNKMKAIYMDSVIEERFGNLEASRVKWEEIVKQDIEDGQYYRKAKRKLKQYGFEY